MSRRRRESSSKLPDGRGTLRTMINCLYSMILASILGVASATYFYVIGPRNVLALSGITATFAASALNLAYLVLHHVLAWRYARESASFYRQHNNTLHSACMMISGLILVAWLTASILGLLGASKAPFCSKDNPATLMWKTLDGCKIQRASVVGSLLNLLNSFVLCYALKSSDRPFAASLIGVSSRNHKKEDLDISRQSSFAVTFESPNEKNFGIRSCSTPVTPTPQPRGRRSWLPRLDFQLPPAHEHPSFQHGFEQMALAISQSHLSHSLPRQTTTNHFSRPSYSWGYTAESSTNINPPTLNISPSSIYSKSTNVETDTTMASQTEYSSTPSASRGPEEAEPVPAIPERYFHESHTLHNGDRPVRPGFRPSWPPTDFWTFAQEQPKHDALPRSQSLAQKRQRSFVIWPGDDVNPHSRLRVQSVSPKSFQTSAPSPGTRSPTISIAASDISHAAVRLKTPDKAVLRRNLNTGNINIRRLGRKSVESYKTLRRSEDRDDMGLEKLDRELSVTKLQVRRDSRTLVKIRQHRDSAPNIPLKSEKRARWL